MTGLREKTWKKENLKHRLFEVVKMHTPPYRAENTGVPITPGFIVFLSIFQAFRKLSILLHKFWFSIFSHFSKTVSDSFLELVAQRFLFTSLLANKSDKLSVFEGEENPHCGY